MSFELPMRRATDRQRPRRLRKGLYILPSLFTCLNIAAGYFAIFQSISGSPENAWHFDVAAKAIGIAIVADGLDGRIARMTNTTSDFGRELDSLADVIAFGVAPAILAWLWGFKFLNIANPDLRSRLVQLGGIATFLFLVAGASRLARFNIQTNPQPSNPGRPGKKYFVGMPIPAGAGVVAATVHFKWGAPLVHWWEGWIWLGLIVLAGFVMVSTWRFYSFKDIDLRSRRPFRVFVILAGIIAASWFFSQYVLFVLALVYMFSGIFARLFYSLRRPTRPNPPPYKEAPQLQ